MPRRLGGGGRPRRAVARLPGPADPTPLVTSPITTRARGRWLAQGPCAFMAALAASCRGPVGAVPAVPGQLSADSARARLSVRVAGRGSVTATSS
jgi:hypothetical protein